ncbi:polysaccharide deacetylase family protein [Serratia microhaemolytica]|uniref:polysaccharide deacetylase family protein n=1 Tax=Serratia microhaemolytica TaxID=2675110 RepID=UPI000FDCE5EA|nr:polysaccharide deacetylase family protein [Serratia microhaemolytica]
MTKPAFIITIDTEGDNLWQNQQHASTLNAQFLPRFQMLCEKYNCKPVYLTNYEMAMDAQYREFGRDVIARQTAEIGMHLHAWNNPPLAPLTDNDWRYKPYLIEYPAELVRAKVDHITKLLEDIFQVKMRSHRAGRWAFNALYANLLVEYGYQVDCSVTPGVTWQYSVGNPQGHGGSDYRHFPSHAYFVDLKDIAKPGNSPLLEVPMSIHNKYSSFFNTIKQRVDSLRGKKRSPSTLWLRPNGRNLHSMKQVVKRTLANNYDYIEFMLHSSELMPGGSPTFQTTQDIEALYQDLEQLFEWLSTITVSKTLAEYYQEKTHQQFVESIDMQQEIGSSCLLSS